MVNLMNKKNALAERPDPKGNASAYLMLPMVSLGSAALSLYLCDIWVGRAGGLPLYNSVATIPENDVGLVLGTAPTVSDGRKNRFFTTRMQAAAQLYHAGKVKALLLSGSARAGGYDEPAAMQRELAALGVPEKATVLDKAGIRTFDSIVRAKMIYGLDRFTIVSQEFHNRRALFLSRRFQLQAVGLNADSVVAGRPVRARFRETLARASAVLDVYLFDSAPEFLGAPRAFRVSV
jgi:SanA protein